MGLLLFTVVCFKILTERLPFSMPFEEAGKGEAIVSIILLILLFVFIGVHFIITTIKRGLLIYMLILVVINILVWKREFKVDLDSSN
ncbi:hypothetical protein [Tepidimicrobium xylanilyticum]|uniref:hypothetical protein n=1 Tax=Tepidimicrobium xylanilyticum TaxID=1123352 RepID=UPI00295EAF96|nr:hypothetical protein [Tepidimicrobium xylanilyticum]